MPTTLAIRINYVNRPLPDSERTFSVTPADYITLEANDYLIWSKDLENWLDHEPGPTELNEHAMVILNDAVPVTECMLYDDSGNVGGHYHTHKVIGMGENKRFVFCFSFSNATATIPRLEAWDDSDHDSIANYCLGAGIADSFIKAVKTTDALPGGGWGGTPIAGASNYINLDTAALSGAKDLYSNIKVIIPGNYPNPASEIFCLTIRYTYL